MPEIQYSYETVGNSSYVVATFRNGEGIVNYQLQMLANNDIKNIIKANKRQKNDDVLVSYNITSKIALAQMDSKNKIPKLGLIKIIEGALSALEDIEEYQLVSSGIVFDEEYIFVKPGNYEPSFIYVPNSMEDSGIEPLKNFILSLIMGSKVEMTNDNFVQTLLDTLNKPGFSAKDLRKLCNNLKNEKNTKEKQTENVQSTPPSPPVNIPVSNPVQPPVRQQEQPIKQQDTIKPIIPTSGTLRDTIPSDKKKEKTKNKTTKKAEKSKSNPKKGLFFALQIVLAVVVVAIFMSGFLNNADGSLNTTYLFGIILVVGAADLIIYREMFVNKKTDDEDKKKDKKTSKKPTEKSGISIPGKDIPGKPPINRDSSSGSGNASVHNIPRKPESVQNLGNVPASTSRQDSSSNVIPQPEYVAPVQTQQYSQMSDFESEDTVVLDDNNSDGAYLEYFENGLSTKIRLTKGNFMIGKLRGQCDFVLNNNKISKMHAEFITRGTDYFVKDYNSTNGTYINGSNQRIASNAEYQIFNGDRITLANVDMTFRC